jgi:hypothetical protein
MTDPKGIAREAAEAKLSSWCDLIRYRNHGAISGEYDRIVPVSSLPRMPVVLAFLADEDIVEMTLCSTSVGFVKTFTKIHKGGLAEAMARNQLKSPAPAAGETRTEEPVT